MMRNWWAKTLLGQIIVFSLGLTQNCLIGGFIHISSINYHNEFDRDTCHDMCGVMIQLCSASCWIIWILNSKIDDIKECSFIIAQTLIVDIHVMSCDRDIIRIRNGQGIVFYPEALWNLELSFPPVWNLYQFVLISWILFNGTQNVIRYMKNSSFMTPL